MTTNGVSNVEDADMAECDGEKVVTMMDVLQEEQDFEDDANAVLGASDEKNCTYSKGYIKRQAIYACLTCCTEAVYDPTKRAGVCLACSLNCHENHELVELYTKRNFRCDCGNPKFNSHPCQFTPNKNDLNEENEYNQNFSGLYCTCHRPYPDPESTVEDDEMIQCIICEDWLHTSHLDATVPGIDQYSEMVCKACMEKNEFLHDYNHLAVNMEMQEVDVVGINGTDTKLSNGDLNTEKLVNSTDDSSVNIAEKSSDNMDIDTAQIEDKSEENDDDMGNSTSQIHVEEITAKESDDTMETVNTEESSQKLSDVNDESKIYSNTDTTTEETPKPIEDTSEESTKVTLEKSDETANITSEETTKVTSEEEKIEVAQTTKVASEEATTKVISDEETTKVTSHEETTKVTSDEETTKVTSDEETTKVTSHEETTKVTCDEETSKVTSHEETTKVTSDEESTKVTESAGDTSEPQESKEALLKNVEASKESQESDHTVEQDGDSEKLDCTEQVKNKEETIEKTAENGKDDESNVDSNASDAKQEEIASIATGDGVESKTVSADDEMNDSNKESVNTENTDLPQENAIEKIESMETDKISSDIVYEPEINKGDSKETPSNENTDKPKTKVENPSEAENKIEDSKEMKRKLSTEETAAGDDHLVKKPKFNEETCIRPKGVNRVHKGATFWPSNLRQKLCTCSECLSMYKDLSVLFLTDPEDTVFAYETLGKERIDGRATQYEKGLEALSSLDRIQQINALTEYNKMKDKLLDFLKSFKDKQEVVKEEDIKAFFAGMKPKREPDGVYFCR